MDGHSEGGPGGRRAFLKHARAGAGALLAGTALSACGALGLLPPTNSTARAADLTVYLLGGTGGTNSPYGVVAGNANNDILPYSLTEFMGPLQRVINQARQAARGVGTITFHTGASSAASGWFPLPSTTYNMTGQQVTRSDDLGIPMPDVVVCMHPQMDNYLANRALDLAPYVKDAAAAVRGIPGEVLREGLAYAVRRGTIQASVPVLRNPLVCLVPSTVEAAPRGKLWTADQFGAAMATAAKTLVQPNAPLPYLPAAVLAPAAILGNGGTIARRTGTSATASFAAGGGLRGVSTLVGWGRYCSNGYAEGGSGLQYAFWVGDGRSAFLTGKPPSPAPVAPLVGATWQIAPLPSFPVRAAVPMTNNIDVLVFRHTSAPAAAASFALQLVSESVQANLLGTRSGLALRPAQAERQLASAIRPVQGARFLADGSDDVIPEDWMGGPEDDANAEAWQTITNDLGTAFDALLGPLVAAPLPAVPQPSAAQIQNVLMQAQGAANNGQAYNALGS